MRARFIEILPESMTGMFHLDISLQLKYPHPSHMYHCLQIEDEDFIHFISELNLCSVRTGSEKCPHNFGIQ